MSTFIRCDFCGRGSPKIQHAVTGKFDAHICVDCAREALEILDPLDEKVEEGGAA